MISGYELWGVLGFAAPRDGQVPSLHQSLAPSNRTIAYQVDAGRSHAIRTYSPYPVEPVLVGSPRHGDRDRRMHLFIANALNEQGLKGFSRTPGLNS